MNQLSLADRAQIVSALTEGVSIRGAARLYNFSKVTVNALARNVGNGCIKLHDAMMVGLQCQRLEIDEIHSFVQNKKSQEPTKGQQYTFIALCGTSRAIVSYKTGKRTTDTAKAFLEDTRQRVVGEPDISSDCFVPYLKAIRETCGQTVKYGRISKSYGIMATGDIVGRQDVISTQRVERQNLTLRQNSKRFGRRSWGFSKNFESHCAAVGLYVFHYNFCRINQALRITPAMQLGLSNHVWTIEQLVSAALHGVIEHDSAPSIEVAARRVTYTSHSTFSQVETYEEEEIEEPPMARIRTIKPEFFRHRKLYLAERETGLPLRLAFAGLWTCADREGRFKWEPEELKLDCLPYDEVDFSRVLDALATRGFITKYGSDDRAFGCIPSWKQHQVINNRETASSLPEPTEPLRLLTRASRVDDACLTPLVHAQGEGKGREGEDAAPNGAHSDEADLYRRGKQVLGKNAGGLISDLRKSKGGSIPLARSAIEQAATKENPREYIGRVIAGPKQAVTADGTPYPEGII